jgi:hypothetical protein
MNIFKKTNKDHLELTCPECDCNTKVKTEHGVKCSSSECQTSFGGMVFKRKKYLTRAAVVLLVSGAVTGITVNETIEDERLSYESEFTLMTACINRNGRSYSTRDLEARIDQCSCSVRKVVNNLGVDSKSNDADEVVDAFFTSVNTMMKECN